MALSDTIYSFEDVRRAFLDSVRSGKAEVGLLAKENLIPYQCIQCGGFIKENGYSIILGLPADRVRDQCFLHTSCYDHLLSHELAFPY